MRTTSKLNPILSNTIAYDFDTYLARNSSLKLPNGWWFLNSFARYLQIWAPV